MQKDDMRELGNHIFWFIMVVVRTYTSGYQRQRLCLCRSSMVEDMYVETMKALFVYGISCDILMAKAEQNKKFGFETKTGIA